MIKSLVSLRGVFILFIFFHHCLYLYPGGGTMAVTFFFVLGGFSMTLGYKDRILMPEFSYREYIKRRYIKFLPLHWITLLLSIPLTLLSFSWIQLPAFFLNAVLLHTWIPIKDVYFSYNWVSWYLADTMFMTMMFPLVFKLVTKSSSKGKICIAACIAILYVTTVALLPVEDRHAILYICPYMRLTDFVFGMFLALGYQKYKDTIIHGRKSIVYQIITIISIILLVSLSCVLSKETRMIAPYYWPLVAITIVTAVSSSLNGGGYFIGKQVAVSSWRNELHYISYPSVGSSIHNAVI